LAINITFLKRIGGRTLAKIINIQDKMKSKEGLLETFTIKRIKDSNVLVNFKATSEDISLLLGLVYKQLLFAREELQTELCNKNATKVEYWRTILKTFTSLNDKLVQSEHESHELTFVEFDCLLGALEVELQENGLKRLMNLPPEDDIYMNRVDKLYGQLLPLYDKKKSEVTKKSCLT
jgi:hypothetical protein